MKKEYDTFRKIMGFEPCGIRMHYVRFDDQTFNKLNSIGYRFDSTEFDKQNCGARKDPYKVGNMWEFPLTIMDSYLPDQFEEAKKKTLEIMEECKGKGLQYITILFHDNQFCDDYQDMKKWYEWLLNHLSDSDDFELIPYHQAIRDMAEDLGR